MSNTYTFNNLNFTAELMQNADFVQSIEESINDYLPITADFDYKYCIDTNTLTVTVNCDLTVEQLADLADCYSELLLMAQSFA